MALLLMCFTCVPFAICTLFLAHPVSSFNLFLRHIHPVFSIVRSAFFIVICWLFGQRSSGFTDRVVHDDARLWGEQEAVAGGGWGREGGSDGLDG